MNDENPFLYETSLIVVTKQVAKGDPYSILDFYFILFFSRGDFEYLVFYKIKCVSTLVYILLFLTLDMLDK